MCQTGIGNLEIWGFWRSGDRVIGKAVVIGKPEDQSNGYLSGRLSPKKAFSFTRERLAFWGIQQCDHFLLQDREIGCAVMLAVDAVVTTDDECGRQAENPAEGVGEREIAGRNRVVHLRF